MKKIILLCIISLLLACSDNDLEVQNSYELDFDDQATSIQGHIGEFMYVFQLENNELIPTKKFQSDDELNFYFSIYNNSSKDIIVDGKLISPDFFSIYTKDHIKIGTPYSGFFCEYINAPMEFELASKKELTLRAPWGENYMLPHENYYPFCFDYNNPTLDKGNYYAIIQTKVPYTINGTVKDSPELFLKIHFKIE